MTKKQITIEEVFELVDFEQGPCGGWRVKDVIGNVWGSVWGSVKRCVGGNVEGNVEGNVGGTINNRKWFFMETREEKFRRLLHETGDTQLIDAFNQLKENS